VADFLDRLIARASGSPATARPPARIPDAAFPLADDPFAAADESRALSPAAAAASSRESGELSPHTDPLRTTPARDRAEPGPLARVSPVPVQAGFADVEVSTGAVAPSLEPAPITSAPTVPRFATQAQRAEVALGGTPIASPALTAGQQGLAASAADAPGPARATPVQRAMPVVASDRAASDASAAPPAIRISIGRIDVRATVPTARQPSAPPPQRAVSAPRLSLDEFLARSSTGRHR